MRKKENSLVLVVVLCLILGTILVAVQSCKRDRSSTYRAAALGISAQERYPSWSPDGKKIAFVSNIDGDSEIYIMNVDGSNQTNLTENPAVDLHPTFSPDGMRIAFDSDRDGNREIYVMNADGSDQIRLTNEPAAEYAPSWSPDGKKIAFHSNRDGNLEIYTMNADGYNQTNLTENPAVDAWPSWSPDGSRITFNSRRDGNPEVYIMNIDGYNTTRLTDNPANDWIPSWSPDGTRIVFFSDRDGNYEIYTMNTDGSDLIRLTNNPAVDDCPSWSPDGQKIAFPSDRDFNLEIFVMDADGSNPVNLTNNVPINATYGLEPLPRSELNLDEIPYQIVFESYRETEGKENWEICLIDADGSNFVNLTNTPDIDEMYPHASPDGQRICFVADEGEDLESKRRNVYYMNIDGTERVKIAENAYEPCWSGDGKYIAYLPGEYPRYNPSASSNKGLEIYNVETGEAKRHPNDEIQHIWGLCWSPDNEWFVFAKGRGVRRPENALKADDKTMMYLSFIGCTPDISSDGKQLAWNGLDWNLNIGNLDFNSDQHNVTDHKVVVVCDREHWVYHADWSPYSNYFAFSYAKYGNDGIGQLAPGCNICICDLRTGKWTKVTTDGKHNKQPDWVPVQIR